MAEFTEAHMLSLIGFRDQCEAIMDTVADWGRLCEPCWAAVQSLFQRKDSRVRL